MDDVLRRQLLAVHRDALDERTRERVPLDWAATRSNLAAAEELLAARRQ